MFTVTKANSNRFRTNGIIIYVNVADISKIGCTTVMYFGFKYTSANGLGMHLSSSPPKRLCPCSLAVFSEKRMFSELCTIVDDLKSSWLIHSNS